MKSKTLAILMAAVLTLVMAAPVLASPPYPEGDEPAVSGLNERGQVSVKPRDIPNLEDYMRLRERQRLLEAEQVAEANALAQTGTDRVLVILVEFTGTDTYTWTVPTNPMSPTIRTGSTWDPLGFADPDEDTGVVGDCSVIQGKIEDTLGYTLTEGDELTFTYQGPMHNRIPTPLSLDDRSGDTIFTTDFSKEWFEDFMFGNGVEISYTTQADESVYANFLGQSVADYYTDMSAGVYTVTGDVVGWVGVPHSTWYYDADECPGSRSGPGTVNRDAQEGVLDGTAKTLVRDALDAVNAMSDTIPGFDWANYDLDGNGVIDRLWIVHAGYGTEDSTTLLNRMPITGTGGVTDTTHYGEASVWSHSSAIQPYSVTQDVAAGPYIIMPENGGIGVFAHEYGHNLGADDLYAYGHGQTSAGFWTLMADDWTGFPIGFEPPAVDPWHLDMWGWLDPMVIDDPTQEYVFTLGQASRFETIPGVGPYYRGARIDLEDIVLDLPVDVWQGDYYWWGGAKNLSNAMMTTTSPIDLSGTSAVTLTFDMAYHIEDEWDFLWVQVSDDMGATWDTITNTNTQCVHDPGWIGEINGFPEDLCGAGLGGFYGHNASFPAPDTEMFDLSDYTGENIMLRFWYMTDWGSLYEGAFIDSVAVTADTGELFSDDAESGDANWAYGAPWQRSDGTQLVTHNFYLQYRNVSETGGYDSALGDERWRFGPANTGLLMWYNNNFYSDNEIYNYLEDDFGFGPKGRMLVIDSHPEPYRDPNVEGNWLGKEHTNLTSRGLIRDAAFSLWDTVDFTMTEPYVMTGPVAYEGRPAVPSFSDALGYYPGVADEGDGTYWSTVDWDASAAMPAKDTYSIKAASGYPGYHIMFRGDGWFGFWGWDEAGTGNPGDDNAQYGWNVEILDQTNMTATVRVYNQMVTFDNTWIPESITPDMAFVGDAYTVTYQTVVENEGTEPVSGVYVTYTLDSDLTFVSLVEENDAGTVVLPTRSWWTDELAAGEVITLTLKATGTVMGVDTVSTIVEGLAGDVPYGPVPMDTTISPTFRIYLPLIARDYTGTAVVP